MLSRSSWLAIFAISLFRAPRWVGSIWMMALWAWRVRRVRCWGFGGSGGRLLRRGKVRGDYVEEGEGVGDGMYGIFSSYCLRYSVRFAPYSCCLYNVIIRDKRACSLRRFLIAVVSLHHYYLRYPLCPDQICVSIIRYHPSTLRVICRTSTLGFYDDVSFPSSCFQRSISQTRYVHLRFA